LADAIDNIDSESDPATIVKTVALRSRAVQFCMILLL
jgi:hypothetical protein